MEASLRTRTHAPPCFRFLNDQIALQQNRLGAEVCTGYRPDAGIVYQRFYDIVLLVECTVFVWRETVRQLTNFVDQSAAVAGALRKSWRGVRAPRHLRHRAAGSSRSPLLPASGDVVRECICAPGYAMDRSESARESRESLLPCGDACRARGAWRRGRMAFPAAGGLRS